MFSACSRPAVRTRFFCWRMFGITEKEPAERAEAIVAARRVPHGGPSPCLSCSPRDRPVTQETVEPAPSAEPDALGQRRRLSHSAAIFGVATGLSRVLGLVREIVARNYFGVAGDINAFTIAFQVPNLIRALVADMAFTSAFVPVFSELLVKGERRRAWARRLEPVLDPPARPRRDHRALHAPRAARHGAVRDPDRDRGPRR